MELGPKRGTGSLKGSNAAHLGSQQWVEARPKPANSTRQRFLRVRRLLRLSVTWWFGGSKPTSGTFLGDGYPPTDPSFLKAFVMFTQAPGFLNNFDPWPFLNIHVENKASFICFEDVMMVVTFEEILSTWGRFLKKHHFWAHPKVHPAHGAFDQIPKTFEEA